MKYLKFSQCILYCLLSQINMFFNTINIRANYELLPRNSPIACILIVLKMHLFDIIQPNKKTTLQYGRKKT